MGSRFDGGVLVVDSIIHKDGFFRLDIVFLIAGLQSVDLGGVVHELAMLYAFDGQEVSDGFEDILKVDHLGLDVEGRGHGELAVAQLIKLLEDFDHVRIEGAIPEEVLVREPGEYKGETSESFLASTNLSFSVEEESTQNYPIGTKVLHPKFGAGIVINRSGEEEDLKLEVFFKSPHGKKKLAANLANLIIL